MDVSATVFQILMHKARKWVVFLTLSLLDAHAQGNPSEYLDETFPVDIIGCSYRMVKIALS